MRPTKDRTARRMPLRHRRHRRARAGNVPAHAAAARRRAAAAPSSSTTSSASASGSASPATGATPASRGTRRSTPAARPTRPPSNWNPLDTGQLRDRHAGARSTSRCTCTTRSRARTTRGSPPATQTAGWKGNTYVINVRSGVKWSDGQALTGADVAYSINLARTNAADPYSTNVATVASATASGNTVTVTFKGTPGYTEFTDYLWKAPVLPQARLVQGPRQPDRDLRQHQPRRHRPDDAGHLQHPGGRVPDQAELVGHQRARPVSFKFKYLVDVVNGSNEPGARPADRGRHRLVEQLPARHQPADVGGRRQLRLHAQDLLLERRSHYMLSANTVWLEPNTSVAPMSNVNFRKAMAVRAQPVGDRADGVRRHRRRRPTRRACCPRSPASSTRAWSARTRPPTTRPRPSRTWPQSGYNGQTITLQVPQGWSDWMDAHHRHQGRAEGGRHQGRRSSTRSPTAHGQRRPTATTTCAGQQRWPRLHPVELLPAGVRAADRRRSSPLSSTGSGSTRRRTGRWCSRRPPYRADRHRQAGLDLLPAGDGLPSPRSR